MVNVADLWTERQEL